MKLQNTFLITGLVCKNCAAKVKTALAGQNIIAEISDDLTKISLQGANLNVVAINNALNKVGNYVIGEPVEPPKADESSVALTPQNVKKITLSDTIVSFLTIYKPLLLVFAYILLVCFAVEAVNGNVNLHRFMRNFMAGFFLVFSFFKLLDVAGFAKSYAMYDLLAKRVPIYGYIYPFIELGLGAAYLLAYRPVLINSMTFIVMVFSSIGVILAVLNKQKIKCACLGTGFNLPMTTVTIIEDLLMAAMALWMLI
jgi:copper chaperone CopZ